MAFGGGGVGVGGGLRDYFQLKKKERDNADEQENHKFYVEHLFLR